MIEAKDDQKQLEEDLENECAAAKAAKYEPVVAGRKEEWVAAANRLAKGQETAAAADKARQAA